MKYRMAQQRLLTIADQRIVAPRLRWLTLHAPELARSTRAGQYLLVRCAEEGSYDPLLRRALFVGAAEPALGQIGLLYEPSERGLAWLAHGRVGDTIDVIGPLGRPFVLDGRTRNLLMLGSGPGLPALMLLAHEAAARGCAVTLLAGADDAGSLPPPFLLPGEAEYQTIVGKTTDLLSAQPGGPKDGETGRQGDRKKKGKAKQDASAVTVPVALSPISWADQIGAALPDDERSSLVAAIRAVKYRWERGFASALLHAPFVCGVGACGVCAVDLRRGTRLVCSEGPVFDLRDVVRDPY
jgi:dihydroorotate dehydrogenase electron transfer subunit